MRILIVGGVAGGASAAARARRLSESAEIIVFERGNDASFANCGLPYYAGGEIQERNDLFVAGDLQLKRWLNLDIRTRTVVLAIHRDSKTIDVLDHRIGRQTTEPYDRLILAPGAEPLRLS